MVIIRVGMAARAAHLTNTPMGNSLTDESRSAERKRRTQVHITTLTESKVDRSRRSLVCPMSPTGSKNGPDEIEVERDDVREA